MNRNRLLCFAVVAISLASLPASEPAAGAEGGYCVVVSKTTRDDPQWKAVVDALVAKHHATVIPYERSASQSLAGLRKEMPRFVCFVAKPSEATREFVAEVNQLTRKIDDDPYTDAIWGILTGYDSACALRIARHSEPLVVRRVLAGTDVELARCEEGAWYSELTAGKAVRKQPGQKARAEQGPADTTKTLVDELNTGRPQLFITSGHATERDWQIGFAYPNGQFRSQAGQLSGIDRKGARFPVRSDNPKIFLPVGNCLMGHIDGPDAMALAFLNSAGVYQMIGYTVPTWYGYGGWGLLDYFVEQPGRFTLAEAFFANQQALIHRLETYFPGVTAATLRQAAAGELSPQARQAGLTWNDARGLLYDRDNVAFYGDPAWEARMAPRTLDWEQTLTENHGEYCLEIRPRSGQRSFQANGTNGSQRGGRPIVQFLPRRIAAGTVQITEGKELNPIVTDNFLLIPNPGHCDPQHVYRLVFQVR